MAFDIKKIKMERCLIPDCWLSIPLDAEAMKHHLKAYHSSIKFGCSNCDRQFSDCNVLFTHLSLFCAVGEKIDKKKIALIDPKSNKRLCFLENANGQELPRPASSAEPPASMRMGSHEVLRKTRVIIQFPY